MKGKALPLARVIESLVGALLSLTACSSNEAIATTAVDSGNGDAFAEGSSFDATSEMSSPSDAGAEARAMRSPTSGTCGGTRWNQSYGAGTSGNPFVLESGFAVAADRTGNVFATGIYVGDADFGGGARPTGIKNPSMFLLKLDPSGAHVWSKGFGDPGPGLLLVPAVQGFALAADASANVVVGGSMAGTVDFGGGALKSAGPPLPEGGLEALEDAGLGDASLFGGCATGIADCSPDALVAKYDASGAHLWSKIFGAEGGDSVRGVAVDGQGNVYLAGSFQIRINLGGPSFAAVGMHDTWVAKLDPDGHHLWSASFGGIGDDAAEGIAVDSMGNAIVSGVISGKVVFGPDTLTSRDAFDAFVVKLDATDGHVLWAKQARAGVHAAAQGVAVDKKDAIAVIGHHRGSIDWGGGVVTGIFADDVFVAKLDSSGNQLWVKTFGADGNDRGSAVAFDSEGRVVAAGQTSSPSGIDFGGGRVGRGLDSGAFVVQLDAESGHICSRIYAPATPGGLAVDAAGNVIVTGSFTGNLDLGLGPMTSAGAADIFVASFAP